MVEAFQFGGFHSLSQGVRDLYQLNALCAPSSHQSGESGACNSHNRVRPHSLLSFVIGDLKNCWQNTFLGPQGVCVAIAKVPLPNLCHGGGLALLGGSHTSVWQRKEILRSWSNGTCAGTTRVVAPGLIVFILPSHVLPSVPKSSLLVLPELLGMHANEDDRRLSPTLWDSALQQKNFFWKSLSCIIKGVLFPGS